MANLTVSISDVKSLIKQKEDIECEIANLHDVLKNNGVGLKGALVDSENYPLADVDIRSVRHARHRIICLQNDHKQLLYDIETGLHALHSQQSPDIVVATTNPQASEPQEILLKAFAVVDRVEADSPSSTAGLCVGDEILQFGSVTAENFEGLHNIASVVQHSRDVAMCVVVKREGRSVTLSLTPRVWVGRGLLGCNIIVA